MFGENERRGRRAEEMDEASASVAVELMASSLGGGGGWL